MPLEDKSKKQLILEHIDMRRRIGELEILQVERKRAEQALRESKEWYQSLFENSPISLWVEDFSQVKKHLAGLREKGVEDFHRYFEDNPEEVYHCASLVKVADVNRATLELYQASSKEELLSDLGHIFTPESWEAFSENLVAMAMGQDTYEVETVNQTLGGEPIHIILRWTVVSGHENTHLTVFVSILDITKRRQAEEERENLISELQEAREKIRKLTGILPICSSCKKIRDGVGFWHQMESYIRDHSEADFSHSLCPQCSKKLYLESDK